MHNRKKLAPMIAQELISKGNKIVANIYTPESTPTYAVIINCATGVKQTFVRNFAVYLASKGILTITYDYSGVGQSRPKSLVGFESDLVQWAENDMEAVVQYVSQNYTYEKLVFINHSVGGQICPLCPSIDQVDGIINVTCSTAYWKIWPFPKRYLFLFNIISMGPLTWLFGYFPGKKLRIMEDLPKGAGRQWMYWARHPNYVLDCVKGAREKFSKLQIPLIAYSFEDDTTSPPHTIKVLNQWYENCDLTHKHYTPEEVGVKAIGHFGFFREKCKVLWDDLIREIQTRI